MSGLVALAVLAAKATAVLALAFALDRLLARASAALRHATWAAAFAALVLLPLAAVAGPSVPVPLLPAELAAAAGAAEASALGERMAGGAAGPSAAATEARHRGGGAAGGNQPAAPGAALSPPPAPRPGVAGWPGGLPPRWRSLLAAAAAVYALVLLALLARLGLALLAVGALTRGARPVGDEPAWRCALAALPPELARLRPRLFVSGELSVPVVWGLSRPAVLLPEGWERWSGEERSRVAPRPGRAAALAAAVLLPALLLAPVRPVAAAADRHGAGWSGATDALAPGLATLASSAGDADRAAGWQAALRERPDRRGEMTPLMRAVFERRWQEAERLLAAGADPDEGRPSLGTPLILAAETGDPALVRLLLVHGADPTVAETGRERPRDLQRTPLGNAARAGGLEVVDLLLAAGAEVDAAPPGDGTPLLIAAEAGHLDVVRRLVARGAWIDAAIPGDGTPLTAAAREGHAAVVDELLAAGADLDLGVPGDGNPLIMAAANGHRGIAERLLAAGADPDAWVPGDESALYRAVEDGDAPMVRLLLEHGADPDATHEERPVEVAAERGDRRVVGLLLAAGARPLPRVR